MLPFSANCGRKGNIKRETKRNTLLLKPVRSEKGNVNQRSCQNWLPFHCNVNGKVKRQKSSFAIVSNYDKLLFLYILQLRCLYL